MKPFVSASFAWQRHAGELDEREEQLDDEKDYVAKTGMYESVMNEQNISMTTRTTW